MTDSTGDRSASNFISWNFRFHSGLIESYSIRYPSTASFRHLANAKDRATGICSLNTGPKYNICSYSATMPASCS